MTLRGDVTGACLVFDTLASGKTGGACRCGAVLHTTSIAEEDAYHVPLLRVTLENSERDAAVSAED